MSGDKLRLDLFEFDELFAELGEGPWLNEPDAVLWRSEHGGFPCVMIRCTANYTWLSGVAVPPQHAFWGRSLTDVFGEWKVEADTPLYFAGELDDADFDIPLPLQTLCQPMRLQDLWWFFFGPLGNTENMRLGMDDASRQRFRRNYVPAQLIERGVEVYAEQFARYWRGQIEHHWTLTASAVRERGWNEEMIAEYLGDPDERKPNPKYRSPYPMRLYLKKRVLAAERRMPVARRLGRSEPDYSWWYFDPDAHPSYLRCLPLGREDFQDHDDLDDLLLLRDRRAMDAVPATQGAPPCQPTTAASAS